MKPKQDFPNLLAAETARDKRFVEVIEGLALIGDQAAEVWIEMVRWHTRNWATSISESPRVQFPWTRYSYCTLSPLMHYNGLGGLIRLNRRTTISRKLWKLVETSLCNQETVPVWFIYRCEAREKFEQCDYRGTVVSAAVSIESMFRSLIERQLQILPGKNRGLQKRIRAIPMADILRDIQDFDALEVLNIGEQDVNLIKSIVQTRNELLHARRASVTRNEAVRISLILEKLEIKMPR